MRGVISCQDLLYYMPRHGKTYFAAKQGQLRSRKCQKQIHTSGLFRFKALTFWSRVKNVQWHFSARRRDGPTSQPPSTQPRSTMCQQTQRQSGISEGRWPPKQHNTSERKECARGQEHPHRKPYPTSVTVNGGYKEDLDRREKQHGKMKVEKGWSRVR